MELGAFLWTPDRVASPKPVLRQDSTEGLRSFGKKSDVCDPQLWPVVGQNLLQEWKGRIRLSGAHLLSEEARRPTSQHLASQLRDCIRQGLQQILLICSSSYAEIDLPEMIRFHRESRRPATEAFDADGSLGILISDAAALRLSDSGVEQTSPSVAFASAYRFQGYSKRVTSPAVYRDLVTDALAQKCAWKPLGLERNEGVWIDDSARVSPSVRLMAPCYVGANTVLRDGVTVGAFTSIENHCVIDCGTAISASSVLPGAYLGAGLDVHRALVDGTSLQKLDTGVTVDLEVAGLGRRFRTRHREHGQSVQLSCHAQDAESMWL